MKNIHPDDLAYNDVIAPQDIAIYGGLCALATFDRSELSAKVIEDVAFKQFLELVPDTRVRAPVSLRSSACCAELVLSWPQDLTDDLYGLCSNS